MTQVTHTEILALAISALDRKIAEVNETFGAAPSPQLVDMIASIRAPMYEKRQTLIALYKVETGVDYE